ncbi:2-hydroxychromene-2-carboxylate isomerase [Ramlibacter sp. AW1]|uniref:2-hydroxychromene-2-carboxylate isomerase n=1 Tax=Ramlibacter aurantiacus TaxID=2801330 RepID=A0A936ZKZ7_9BURK|nr:2-hydroxychromene-2-carboxylate isomerase [Ramlibacter aurantiacus]MBL0421742.1 2-hydroxychromene-2-carboxylate isomerase [Ramlibacter aurantiacus]
MNHITFCFDVVSPYAWLAFEQLPQALRGLSWRVDLRPVLLAALLKHHGQLGPAEMPGKREWTYRQVLWQARQLGVPLQLPAVHPFNPLPLLRLALACGSEGLVNRHVAETVLRHVWTSGGADANDPARLAELRQRLAPARDPDSDEVKAELRANTDAAIAAGVFGVPSFLTDTHLFWGLDGLPLLRARLEGDPWFDGPDWHTSAQRPAQQRPR